MASGKGYCNTVQEGLFISTEPAQSFTQVISFPNQDGEVNDDVVGLLVLELAESLGVDAKYIRFQDPVGAPGRSRMLGRGTSVKFVILADDAASLAAALSVLTSSESFWNGVNYALANASIPLVNTTGVGVQISELACNLNFRFDNGTQTCIAELMECDPGKFAASGSGTCTQCDPGKYSERSGAFVCDGCLPGHYARDAGAVECFACSRGEYQSVPGETQCKRCLLGTYSNDEGAVVCTGVQNTKSYITAELQVGQRGGPDTSEQQQGENYVEVMCPKAGLKSEVGCGNGLLSFRTTGFFHDGLQATDLEQTRWEYRKGFELDAGTFFYRCPCLECCHVDKSRGNITCSAGSHGVLCATCDQGYFKQLDGSCKTCEAIAPAQAIVLTLLLLVLVVFGSLKLVVRLMRRTPKLWARYLSTKDFLTLRWLTWRDAIVVLAKQLLGFFQVVLLLQSVYRIPFPVIYLDVLSWFAFINLDFLSFARMECYVETNWHTNVQVTAAICIVCLVGTAVTFFRRGATHHAKSEKTRPPATATASRRLSSAVISTGRSVMHEENPGICSRAAKHVSVVLLVLGYCIYPGANAVFFQTFNCQSIDGKRYLRNDLSIDCSDPAHQSAVVLAVLMVVLFSVGLPLLYLSLLVPHRKGFVAESGRSQAALEDVRSLRFFYMDYKVSACECVTACQMRGGCVDEYVSCERTRAMSS
jgi:hypothetical protein